MNPIRFHHDNPGCFSIIAEYHGEAPLEDAFGFKAGDWRLAGPDGRMYQPVSFMPCAAHCPQCNAGVPPVRGNLKRVR